jgi:hypothetical protein
MPRRATASEHMTDGFGGPPVSGVPHVGWSTSGGTLPLRSASVVSVPGCRNVGGRASRRPSAGTNGLFIVKRRAWVGEKR